MERKQMNILIDELPEKVEIEGEEVEINTDYRNVLLYFRMLKDEELEERDKVDIAIRLFFKSVPKDIEKAIKYINEEYIVSWGRKKIRKFGQRGLERAVFDFEQDGGLIFASFWQEYGIDLRKEKMHWRAFKALFDGLSEGTALRRVIQFRQMKPKDMPKERRLELLELQRELRVKDPSVRDKVPSFACLNYNDEGSTGYKRSAREIEKELIEGMKNG
jgi:hypothetical protein